MIISIFEGVKVRVVGKGSLLVILHFNHSWTKHFTKYETDMYVLLQLNFDSQCIHMYVGVTTPIQMYGGVRLPVSAHVRQGTSDDTL